jgi:hypothetical protein
MLLTSETRRQFERGLVKGGDPLQLPIDCPEPTRLRWLERINNNLNSVDLPSLTKHGRRLNNFCIGSDPEFVFVAPNATNKTDASMFGLKPGLAVGCDQNHRLAELRGWPTSSVIEHVAGILTSLRWMYRVYPNTGAYKWRAGAFYDRDGLGGHVHFGRKRPYRTQEVAALDGLATVLRTMQVFSNNEWDRRNAGDGRTHGAGQLYGHLGDIRTQAHGYEYRTLPSWLDTPAKAFMVLTAAKLCILDPELTAAWVEKRPIPESYALLRLLARYYAGRDDDAWILKYMLKGLGEKNPCFDLNTNFRPHWGFPAITLNGEAVPQTSPILPACIKPLASEIKEIEDSLLSFKPLTFVENPPTFRNIIPDNYLWNYQRETAMGLTRAGVGDLLHNFVCHKSHVITVVSSDSFSVSPDIVAYWTAAERSIVRKMFPFFRIAKSGSQNNTVIINREMTSTPESVMKTRIFFLKMGLFPIWTVDSVEENSIKEWKEVRSKIQKKPRIEERTL